MLHVQHYSALFIQGFHSSYFLLNFDLLLNLVENYPLILSYYGIFLVWRNFFDLLKMIIYHLWILEPSFWAVLLLLCDSCDNIMPTHLLLPYHHIEEIFDQVLPSFNYLLNKDHLISQRWRTLVSFICWACRL